MRIEYDKLVNTLEQILLKHGFNLENAKEAALVFVNNSRDGVYSHGLNRFCRIISEVDNKAINPNATLEKIAHFNAFERFNGHKGFGPLNAKRAMDRAIQLSDEFGIGCVALANNNHWLRGGSYGWQAALQGKVGICFTNTTPNMPAWGGLEPKIGNNPFVVGIPKSDGNCIVLDMAMSQYSYGKIDEVKARGELLSYPGGYNINNELTTNPSEIKQTHRILPMGYWKGSGMAIAIDLMITILTAGFSTSQIGSLEIEQGVSQVFIAIDPTKFNSIQETDKIVSQIIDDLKTSTPLDINNEVRYPGERENKVRDESLKNGVFVDDKIWKDILELK